MSLCRLGRMLIGPDGPSSLGDGAQTAVGLDGLEETEPMEQPHPAAVRDDPLFRLGFLRGRDRRWLIIAALAIVSAVIGIIRPGLWLDGFPIGLPREETFSRLTWALVGVPVGLYVYFWLPGTFSSLIPELRRRDLLDTSPVDAPALDAAEAHVDERIGNPWFPIVGVMGGVLYAAFGLLFDPKPGAAETVQHALELVVTAPFAYVGTMVTGRLIVGLSATSAFLERYPARVHPLHGDDAGGWSPLGQRANVLARAAALYGFVAIVINGVAFRAGRDPLESLESVVTLVGYLFLAPLVVWAWLYAPHRAMHAARARALTAVSEAFAIAASTSLPGDGDAEQLSGATDHLAQLSRRRDVVAAAYPVWPMRIAELRMVWAIVLSPLLASGLQIVVDLLRAAVGLD